MCTHAKVLYVRVYVCMPACVLVITVQPLESAELSGCMTKNNCDIIIFTLEELHAEVCYAECLLQRAALTFLQVRNKVFPDSQLLNLPPLMINVLFQLLLFSPSCLLPLLCSG